jgi:hypothetical protein
VQGLGQTALRDRNALQVAETNGLRRRGSASSQQSEDCDGVEPAHCRWPVGALAELNNGSTRRWAEVCRRRVGRKCGRTKGYFQQRGRQTGNRIWGEITHFRRAGQSNVQSVLNEANETPSAFLAKKRPPLDIVYRRVTPNFFVVSSFRNGLIWYDRCNFAGRFITCVLINYPAAEKKQWGGVVTRISNSLANS